MIADLKAKAEGFNRKRLRTALAALLIAGTAGHIMQRSASGSSGDQALSASVPGTPLAAVPAEQRPAPVVAAGMIAAPKPVVLAPATSEVAEAETATVEIAAQPAEATALAETLPAPGVAAIEMPEAVTKSDTDPLLALPGASTVVTTDPPQALAEMPHDTDPAPEEQAIELAAADMMTDPGTEPAPVLPSCEIAFDATVQPGALVLLSLTAPCNAGEEVEFDHAGLKFSEQLGPDGTLILIVPAMTETASFKVDFAGTQKKAVEVTVPDFAGFERVAVMWKGATGLQLHALENGASYGEPGHVWAEAPADPEVGVSGVGGFISVLGSTAEGYAADVYTYPAVLVADGNEPLVSVEAQVMENTCGGEISGDILRSNAGRAPTMEHLSMVVPGCDAVGEYLVLNNLPQDLKLARN